MRTSVSEAAVGEVRIVSENHKSTVRDYLARVNDEEFPKSRAAELAKKWDFDYWDGDRRINYGGYNYRPGFWTLDAGKGISYTS